MNSILQTHLPGYVNAANDFRQLGYDTIVCVTVNDPFVCQAWAKEHKAEGRVRNCDNHVIQDSSFSQVRVLADPDAKFTKALGLEKDMTAVLGNVRSSRYVSFLQTNKSQ